MGNPLEVISVVRKCTPAVMKTLGKTQAFEGTVASVTRVAKNAKGTVVGDLFESLAQLGEKVAGNEGVISLSTSGVKTCSDATIVKVTIKKGKEIVSKITGFISPNKQKIGGTVKGSNFCYTSSQFSKAEHFKQLAQKLGVDIRTATQRAHLAATAGINIKDEKILADVILGKVKPKMPKQVPSNPFHANLTKADPKPMTSYFHSGYQRLRGDDSYSAFNAATNKDRFLGDLFGETIEDSSQSWDAFSKYFKRQAAQNGSVITSRMRK